MLQHYDPPVGVAEILAPRLRRITAPNASPMTFRGTNTYLLGEKSIAVIDPGPDDAFHLSAILDNISHNQHISKIIVTHAHRDHSAMARTLSRKVGAPVLAFGDAHSGRSAAMQALAAKAPLGGGEGLDKTFAPDEVLRDVGRIDLDDMFLQVLHTPGHLGNHICLRWENCCFTGDHVMGWASTLVSPPDGDLTDFMASCEKLQETAWQIFYPGHGDVIPNPNERLSDLITHRLSREREILNALVRGPLTAEQITHAVYQDTPQELLFAAQRNVLAHLVDLYGKSRVSVRGPLDVNALFQLA